MNNEDFFGKWLALAHQRLFNLFAQKLKKEGLDITFEQFIMLKVINANEGVNQQAIALKMGKDKTSVTRAISVLEDHHKVVRITAKDDKRKRSLFLTKEGKEHLALVMPLFLQFKKEFEVGFSQQEISQNIDFLKKVINRIKQLEEQL